MGLAETDDELRRQIGRLCIVGFHGQTPDESISTLIRAPYYVGQIVLFQRNVRDAEQLKSLTRDLQQIARDACHRAPLIIGIDQENGLVTRIKPPIATQLPGPMTLGATRSTEYAEKVAEATGMTLRALGINMNYAPVCDVNNNPDNPVIGVRSFGDDPEAVGRMAQATWTGLLRQGVIPCVKHYPGHGDTAVDSHFGLPRIDKTWEQLEACELIPFRRAVAEGCPAIMTAHIVIGTKEPQLPVTLNGDALHFLRNDLEYDGVIVSDCLEMNAIRTECGGTVNGAVTAVRSGCDCVMICHTFEVQRAALEKIFEEAKTDPEFRKRIGESAKRVTQNFNPIIARTEESHNSNKSFDTVLSRHNAYSASLVNEVYAKSTTLVRARPGVVPVGKDRPVLFISPGEKPRAYGEAESEAVRTRGLHAPSEFSDLLRFHNTDIMEISLYNNPQNIEQILTTAQRLGNGTIILATRNARLARYQYDLATSLAALAKENDSRGMRLVVVATCDPYDFLEEENIETYIVIYEPTPSAFKGAADAIFGLTRPLGILPVAVERGH